MLLTPDRVTLGRILSVHPDAGQYLVNVGTGVVEASYNGADRGIGGVAESGSLVPGTYVWVAFPYDLTQAQAVILAAMLPVGLPENAQYGFPAVYPQQSGPGSPEDLTKQLSESEAANTPAQNAQKTLPDIGVGEWAMSSALGASVAIEHFRAWLAAGPWNGTWHDLAKRLTKHAAWNESVQRFASTESSHQRGELSHETRGVFFDEESSQSTAKPAYTEHAGGLARGVRWQLLTADGAWELASQRVSDDGVVVMSSARGLVLEKRLYAPLRQIADVPQADGPTVTAAAEGPPAPFSFTDAQVALLRVFDVADRARTSDEHVMRRLITEWESGEQIPEKVSAPETMWGNLPPIRTIQTAMGDEVTYYLGRSAIGILPDGSIELTDWTGATVLIGGGNALLSVPGNVCLQAGEDLSLIAGRNLSVLAHESVQVVSDTKQVYVKAEGQLNLLGGNGGSAGVVIESRGTGSAWEAGDGEDFRAGGVLIKSLSDVTTASVTQNVKADVVYHQITQSVFHHVGGSVTYVTPTFVGYSGSEPVWSFTNESAYVAAPVLMTSVTVQQAATILGGGTFGDSIQVNGQIAHKGDATITGEAAKRLTDSIDEAKDVVQASIGNLSNALQSVVSTALTFLQGLPVFNSTLQLLGISLPSAKQLGTDKSKFALPSAHWQVRNVGAKWSPAAVVSPAGNNTQSLPFPGAEVWYGESLIPRVESAYFNSTDVESHQDSYQAEPLSVEELLPMYGNLTRSV